MADIQRTVEVIFEGTDKVSSVMTTISSRIETFAGDIREATQPLADAADKILQINAALLAMGGAAIAGAITAAGNFADQFSEISTLIEGTPEEVLAFKDAIKKYGTESTVALDTINRSIYDAISAGTDYKDSLGLLEASERLAIATKADLQDAIGLVVPTLSAFGEKAESAGDFADILFATVKTGKLTLTELAGPLSTVTGIAGTAGLNFDEVAAAIAGMTAASGASASTAITGLKAAISNILKPTGEAADLADSLGIKFNAQALAAEGLLPFLQGVFEKTGGSAEKMAVLFGSVEGFNFAATAGKDAAGKFADAVEAMGNRAGGAEEAYTKMKDNFELTNQNLLNNIKVTLIDIGGKMLDEWSGIAGGLTSIFQGVQISIADGSFDPVFDQFEGFGKDLAIFLSGIGEALPDALAEIDWTKFTGGLETLFGEIGELFKDFFGDLDLTQSDDLADFIQIIVDGVGNLLTLGGGVLGGISPIVTAIGSIAKGFADANPETVEFVGTVGGFGKTINTAAGILEGIGSGIQGIGTGLQFIAGASLLKGFVSGLGSLSSTLGTAGAIGGVSVVGGLAAAGVALAAFIADLERTEPVSVVWKRVTDDLSTGLPTFIQGFADAGKEVSDFLGFTDNWSTGNVAKDVDDITGKIEALNKELEKTPEQKTFELQVAKDQEAIDAIKLYEDAISNIPEEKITEVSAEADRQSAIDAGGLVVSEVKSVVGGDYLVTELKLIADQQAIDNTSKAIDEIPTEKLLEIKLQGEIDTGIARIKASAETVQTAVEWKAKLDIAEVEAATKRFEASALLVGDSFASTGQTLTSLADSFVNASSLEGTYILDYMRDENRRRNEILQLQKDLVQAEIDRTKATTAAVNKGQSLISITGEGLEPELEAFMWKILSKIQLRAAESDAAFLLGIQSTPVT